VTATKVFIYFDVTTERQKEVKNVSPQKNLIKTNYPFFCPPQMNRAVVMRDKLVLTI
jgi:hypothetical protein